jgi:hypothetical protein
MGRRPRPLGTIFQPEVAARAIFFPITESKPSPKWSR